MIGAEHQSAAGQYYLRDIRGAFDVVALGATATGSVGDTVQVEVGLRNDGPGVPDGIHLRRQRRPVHIHPAGRDHHHRQPGPVLALG
ncbi:hypothetical protein [Micromonospora inositola]|uniref:Uncharacterized protein n=1 Tax=Micromonospora inositola TaxID=47865 RepID=A0A1C5HN68_9ACTN|nr:hypothetical protein [Micromonospora inositola]SCG47456.1 hypothetical protein GA0070613_1579 [Micromonospora inositola]